MGRQQWNTVNQVFGVSKEFEPLVEQLTERYGPELTLESAACLVGRWFACQDQSHINAQGFTPNQLMHHMVEFYFQHELEVQAAARKAVKDSMRLL